MTVLHPDEKAYDAAFFDRCTSLFLGMEAGHMGADSYHRHDGARVTPDGQRQSMSGVELWNLHAATGTLPRLHEQAFDRRLPEVATLAAGMAIVDYGPGSMQDGRRLIEATNGNLYVPVDVSAGVIGQARELAARLPACRIEPALRDIFAPGDDPVTSRPALAMLLGGTVSNLPGRAPAAPPRQALAQFLQNLAKPVAAGGGMLLISAHAEQDGARNRALYGEAAHADFGVNFLYRMQAELPMRDFDPAGFTYAPVWHQDCRLLAHCVRATHAQNFAMGAYDEIRVRVKAGDLFHYNNSFKYEPSFFELCARDASLPALRRWRDDGEIIQYMLGVAAAPQPARPTTRRKAARPTP